MKKEYIVFLDFDGPLFSNRALMLLENHEFAKANLKDLKLNPLVTYWCADPIAIAMLVHLYHFRPFKIVVSSAWGELHTKEQIENLLKKNGLGIPLHENWKINTMLGSKPEQIKTWLDENKYEGYMVIDDTLSGEEFNNIQLVNEIGLDTNQIVIVSVNDGISYQDYYKMKAISANWD